MKTRLEAEFDDAMLELYRTAKRDARYDAKQFLSMVVDRGGKAAATSLVESEKESTGFTALWERGRLDLTVEVEILKPKWRDLFTRPHRLLAIRRLQKYQYTGPLPDARTV